MMIPERHMKQAKRIDNGEIVVGYYSACVELMDKPILLDYITDVENNSVIIYPNTVEDVAVKPIKSTQMNIVGVCPNCRMAFIYHDNHCKNCGQRIDWQ